MKKLMTAVMVAVLTGAVLFAANANIVNDIHRILALGAGLIVAGSVHAVNVFRAGFFADQQDFFTGVRPSDSLFGGECQLANRGTW